MRQRLKAVPQIAGKDVTRFWSYAQRGAPDQCWLWTGHRKSKNTAHSYGNFVIGKSRFGAHRISYALAYGPIPAGAMDEDATFVMHTCDTPLCVNPAHLRLGRPAENSRDMLEKGRSHRLITPAVFAEAKRLMAAERLCGTRAARRLNLQINPLLRELRAERMGLPFGTNPDVHLQKQRKQRAA